MVCSGRVKLTVSSRDGKTAILRIAGPGEILALSAAMSGTPHETSAEAVELCRARAIRVSDFLDFLQSYPEASAEATTCLLTRLSRSLTTFAVWPCLTLSPGDWLLCCLSGSIPTAEYRKGRSTFHRGSNPGGDCEYDQYLA